MSKSDFVFVVDTNLYAGNFSRQLCGYCTGVADEYPGQEEVEVFHEEVAPSPIEGLVEFRPVGDTNVFLSPCDIWPNPAWFNNGSGGAFRHDDPEAETKALAAYKKFQVQQAEKQIALVRGHVALDPAKRTRSGWTDEAIAREISRQQKTSESAEAETAAKRCTAYMSVGIFMYRRPDAQQVALLKDRVHKFVQYCRDTRFLPDGLVIEGFRMVEQVMTEKTSCL